MLWSPTLFASPSTNLIQMASANCIPSHDYSGYQLIVFIFLPIDFILQPHRLLDWSTEMKKYFRVCVWGREMYQDRQPRGRL